LLAVLAFSCSQSEGEENIEEEESVMYFPAVESSEWESVSPESLNWNENNLDSLYNFLSEEGTRAFIILKDGKIVLEKYWGETILATADFDQNSLWYWASAGKTLTAFMVGIAQSEGLLSIQDKTSDYLGENWSSMDLDKENLITLKHQLSMTTGLDYSVDDLDCTDSICLQYKADAGSQWYYHNAPYTLLDGVLEAASGMSFDEFTDEKVEAMIGSDGDWKASGDNHVYWSTARDAARFGLLLLNKGYWNGQVVLDDEDYFADMCSSSQSLNPSYGYLTWLNGQESIIFPGLASSFSISLSEDAPDDLFAAMGKNGQFIDVIPSKSLVVIRMGEAPDNSLVPTVFHNNMWEKINAVID
jgi:CubicO group peptidase (beta-lactamase class C family)